MPRRQDQKDPDSQVAIRDFAGWKPNADPHDLEPGAATEQVNATSIKPGELRVRLGYKVVKFED